MQHAQQALHGMLGERSRAWAAVWQPRPTKLCATTEPLVLVRSSTLSGSVFGIGLHLSTFMSTFLYEPNDPPFSCVGRARPRGRAPSCVDLVKGDLIHNVID
jgi:hypothetical protein